ncbi:UdgX family uracil-DNA binding protein [Sorangium sp. So ce315]|uniref:UdgX family uracil-DNA binding protein n=1 Tax=Sorangium sp. So ce315 TaxID=3133299 RepID=UPI003F613128
MIRAPIPPTFEAFRDAARALLARGAPPEDVLWEDAAADGQGVLFGAAHEVSGSAVRAVPAGPAAPAAPPAAPADAPRPRVPAAFVRLATTVACHRDAARFPLLYRALFRLTHGEPYLLELAADPDVARLRAMDQAVRRDVHKMHAFVRFRRVEGDGERYVAWYRPDHRIVRLGAPFFERRFPSMAWSILTPDESAHWDGAELRYGPGLPRHAAPREDELEELFRTYYRAIYNPARVNLRAMRAEMPAKHWSTLPELSVMSELVRDAASRVDAMQASHSGAASAAEAYVPGSRALPVLREAAASCQACALCERATQTVFGEGPAGAPLMLVGEQPGDEEDLCGRPFVGPAGRVLDEALAGAGLSRGGIYVTNAVKHFKWEPRGERRLHARPLGPEIQACRAWLLAEVEAVRPRVIVCLGATAARSFLGGRFSVTQSRGQVFKTPWAESWMATYHPAALLRMPDEAARAAARAHFQADLAKAARLLAGEEQRSR